MTYLVGRTSHYATAFGNLRTVSEKSAQYRLASDRLTSGRKFSELSAYRSDLPDVLTYQRVVDRASNDHSRISKVLTITETYENSLSKNAGGLQGYIAPLLEIVREGVQPDLDATAWRELHSGQDFDNRLRAIQSLLNTKVGNRYIFAGRRYSEGPPVRDLTNLVEAPLPSDAPPAYENFLLRNLPASATDANNALIDALSITPTFPANANADRVADHDIAAEDPPVTAADIIAVRATAVGELETRARQTSVLQVEEQQLIEYGLSSNAETINQLLLGVRLIKQALNPATTTLADRETLLTDAQELLEGAGYGARDGLRRLRQSGARTTATLLVSQERQIEIGITTQSLVDRLAAADTTRAGIELSVLSQQFSATLQTIETRNSFSLARLL